MKIICGLGNPGEEFLNTRHNLGFLVLDEIQKAWNFPEFRESKNFFSKVSEGVFGNEKIVLIKPQTFMNNSGKSVKIVVEHYKLKPENLWVVHDDLDIPFGKIKISRERNAGGHKGVQSVIDCLDSKNFVRFRIGIKPEIKPINAKNFVLKKFTKQEKKLLKNILVKARKAVEKTIACGIEKAMTEFNK